jgi:hypothetical protein
MTVLSGNYEDKAGNRIVAFLQDQPFIYMQYLEAGIPRELPIGKKTIGPPPEKSILEGTNKAWEQYKNGKGTRVTARIN